jgi:hypothetical protein
MAGDDVVDNDTMRVWHAGRTLELSMRQHRLMEFFVMHAGEPLRREQIMAHAWDRRQNRMFERSIPKLSGCDAPLTRHYGHLFVRGLGLLSFRRRAAPVPKRRL